MGQAKEHENILTVSILSESNGKVARSLWLMIVSNCFGTNGAPVVASHGNNSSSENLVEHRYSDMLVANVTTSNGTH